MKISIIVPCHNEEQVIETFNTEIIKILSSYDYELIYVNDGSTDNTLKKLMDLTSEKTSCIDFSRNFGKESAMYAGLLQSTGDYVCIMDADLQHPPFVLLDMINKIQEGYDSVAAIRKNRKGEKKVRNFLSRSFYTLSNKLVEIEIKQGSTDFRLMNRKFVDSLLKLCEYNRFSKGMMSWVGFNTYFLEYEDVERVAGETSWNFLGLFKYAIEGILSFSTVPLKVATYIGILISFGCFLMMVYQIYCKLVYNNAVDGWTTLVVLILFVLAVLLIFLGILGEYIARIYLEVKNRPVFIINEIYSGDNNTSKEKNEKRV